MAKGMMAGREWDVRGVVTPEGEFLAYELTSFEQGAADPMPLRQAVLDAMGDIEAVGNTIGGAFSMIPIRAQVRVNGEVVWQTIGWKFAWEALAPAAVVRGVQENGAPTEPEPVAVSADALAEALAETPAPPMPPVEEPVAATVNFQETDPDETTPLGAEVDHEWAGAN